MKICSRCKKIKKDSEYNEGYKLCNECIAYQRDYYEVYGEQNMQKYKIKKNLEVLA